MKRLLLVFGLVFFAGCTDYGNPYTPTYTSPQTQIYTTKVISEPPGARIELDDDYIGTAPLEIQWTGWSDSGRFRDDHIIRALPIYEGQYTQTKFFRCGSRPIPKTILFDMNLAPAPRQYELNIQSP